MPQVIEALPFLSGQKGFASLKNPQCTQGTFGARLNLAGFRYEVIKWTPCQEVHQEFGN
jgi:hypothetical protein